jgi:hypothetical protein
VELPPELAGAVHLEVLLPDIRTYFRRYQQRWLYLLRPCACNKELWSKPVGEPLA